jgi:hypothetical protein
MGNKGNQAASGNPNASQAGKHPDQASTSTCGSMAGAWPQLSHVLLFFWDCGLESSLVGLTFFPNA